MGELSYTVGGDNNLVSFKSAARVPITSLKAHFKPKQDLHGYSKPWVGGAGKNLFNINSSEHDPSNIDIYNNSIRIFTPGTYTRCASWSNYRDPSRILDFSILGNIMTVKSTTGYGVGYAITILPETQYAISAIVNGVGASINIAYYDSNGNFLSEAANETNVANSVITTPSNSTIAVLIFRGTYADTAVTFANIQFEKSSSITSYEPYENICPIEGWTNANIYVTGEELPFVGIPGITDSLGIHFVVDDNGIITAEGTPTSWSQVMCKKYTVNGDEILYGRIIGNLKNVTNVMPQLYDANGTRLYYGEFGDGIFDTYLDLKQYPGVKTVIVGIKRLSNGIPVTGQGTFVLTKGSRKSINTIPVTFPITGKNLFNVTDDSIIDYFENENGIYKNTSTDTRSDVQLAVQLWKTKYVYIKLGGMLYNVQTGHISFQFTNDDTNCAWIRFKYNGNNRDFGIIVPFPYGLGTYTVSCDVLSADPTTVGGLQITNIQIERGSTATSYIPYSDDNMVYGGYVDIAAGEMVKEYDSYTFTGSADDQLSYYNTSQYYGIERHLFRSTKLDWLPKYSSTELGYYSIAISAGNVTSSDYISAYIGTPIHQIIFTINSSACENTVESFSAWLSEHPLQIVYPLKYPIHIPIPKSELTTFLNVNTVWSNTNDITEASYAIHDTAPIRAAKHRIAANEPHIETIESSIAHFDTDMIAPLKECKIHFAPKQDTNGYGKVWIGGCGKNLFDENSVIYNTWTREDGTTYSTDRGCRTPDISVSPGDSYVVNYKGAEPYSSSMIELDENKNFIIRTHASWNSTSSDSPLCVTLTENTRYIYVQVFNKQDATITPEILKSYKIQLEKGSVSTSYEPYENICPIEGTTDIELYKTGKSLFGFNGHPFTVGVDYYNGNAGWFNNTDSSKIPHVPITYSVDLDMTNCESPYTSNNMTWVMTNKNLYRYLPGTSFESGQSGRSIAHMTITDSDDWAVFGLSIRKGGVASNPMVEIGNEATVYEPYNGETIPISFPASKNLFDEKYEGIISTLTYHSLYVGDGDVTASTTTPRSNPDNYSNIFVFPGQVTTGASTGLNDIYDGFVRTITPIDGYITIAYRNGYGVDPREYHTQIEKGTKATTYEPYGTFYGGYVDLKQGKLIQTHKCITLNGSEYWGNYYTSQQMHFYLSISDKKIGMKTSISSSFPNVGNDYFWDNEFYCQYGDHPNLKNIYVNAPYKMPGLVTEWKAYLAEHPMQLCYELETPIEYVLSPIQLKTLRGQNNIWSNSNGNISIQYYKRGR